MIWFLFMILALEHLHLGWDAGAAVLGHWLGAIFPSLWLAPVSTP